MTVMIKEDERDMHAVVAAMLARGFAQLLAPEALDDGPVRLPGSISAQNTCSKPTLPGSSPAQRRPGLPRPGWT